jgi:tetratricopeptide (TPR) repeat protein
MGVDTRASEFFVAGGTLRPGAPSYVERPADDELFSRALAGEFCYVLTPRQMGKSSLMIRTARRLEERGVNTAIIDLTRIGADVSVEQWYLSLLTQLKRRLRLSVDPVAWWHERAVLGYVGRFTDFIRDVILTEVEEKVVIFMDEIDITLNLDFRDDFFAAVRALYNARAEDAEFDRLTFVLLGVASPPDLIKDRARTPFNIGYGIALQEFSQADAAVLRDGLEAVYPGQGEAIFTRIYHWTNGHPYLTQKLCLAVAETRDGHWTSERVDDLVERLFLSEEARKEANLKFVQDKILAHSQRSELLKRYKKVVRGKRVGDDGQSSIQNQLKLSGLVKAESGYLHIRNEIYRRTFDLTWVSENSGMNWTPIWASIAGIAIGLVLLIVGFLARDYWVEMQVQDAIARFYQAHDPEGMLTPLAKIFKSKRLLGSEDYDHRARDLFYGLENDKQLALFSVNHPDVIVVIKGVYTALADTDGTNSTGPLLEAMLGVLGRLDKQNESAEVLGKEIFFWLDGRQLANRGSYSEAEKAYDQAIASNGKNPATLYERARVLIQLSEYQRALSDLDRVVAIAKRAAAPTPTLQPTTSTLSEDTVPFQTLTLRADISPIRPPTSPAHISPIQAPPTDTRSTTPALSPDPTEAPTPAATSEPVSIVSEFATFGQMISTVRNLIYSNPDLVSFLASAPGSEYSNLREYGLVPTARPIVTLTTTPTPAIRLPSTTTLPPAVDTPSGLTGVDIVNCSVPLNGDFAIAENNFAAYWNREFFPPLFVDQINLRIFIGYDENELFALPGIGGCASARLYQDFYLPEDCQGDLQLQFDYQLFSYDYDRSAGDAFLVYAENPIDAPRFQIYTDRSHQSQEDSLNGMLYTSGPLKSVGVLPSSLGSGPVRLWFEVRHCEEWPREQAWWPTWVYLDNVIIVSQLGAAPTPTSTPTSTAIETPTPSLTNTQTPSSTSAPSTTDTPTATHAPMSPSPTEEEVPWVPEITLVSPINDASAGSWVELVWEWPGSLAEFGPDTIFAIRWDIAGEEPPHSKVWCTEDERPGENRCPDKRWWVSFQDCGNLEPRRIAWNVAVAIVDWENRSYRRVLTNSDIAYFWVQTDINGCPP